MEFESKVLSKEIFDTLYETEKTFATAESCTSGRVAEAITAVPGASDYYVGGVVCYSNKIKEQILGVPAALIEEKNAVSEEVATEMVKGACEMFGTDYAVAVTGFAGPGNDGSEIPVGTIYVACGSADEVRVKKLSEDFGRERNLLIATNSALALFAEFLNEKFPKPDLSEVPAPEAK